MIVLSFLLIMCKNIFRLAVIARIRLFGAVGNVSKFHTKAGDTAAVVMEQQPRNSWYEQNLKIS